MNDRIKKRIKMRYIKKYGSQRFYFCNNDFENIVFDYLFSFPEGWERFNALKGLPHLCECFKYLSFKDYQLLGGITIVNFIKFIKK